MLRGLVGFILLLLPAVAAADDTPVRALERQMRGVIDRAEPSVVAVIVSHARYPGSERSAMGRLGKYTAVQAPTRPFGAAPPPDRLDLSNPENVADHLFGSGVVLHEAGLVLTNYHLIDGATKVYVRAASGKGSYADVHAADARSDLAVLKLLDHVPGLKEARIAPVRIVPGPNGEKATVARGDFVIALGHPQAAGAADGVPSASWGILSNVRRRAPGPGREDQRTKTLHQYGALFQTDARITLGCSGGALLNLDGELVGLTTPTAAVAGADTAGGFAIPMDPNYRRIVDTLKAGLEVEYGFLGVSVSTERPGRLDDGLSLSQVTPNTPASLAGLRSTDKLLAIDGNPLLDQDDLFLYIGAALAGTRVELTVARFGGRMEKLRVVLAKNPHSLPWLASVRPAAVHGLRVDYTSVLLLPNANNRGGPPVLPLGVLVRDLDPGSPADAKFKKLGDGRGQWIVTHVDGRPVTTPPEFYRAAAGKTSVTLKVTDPLGQSPEQDITLP